MRMFIPGQGVVDTGAYRVDAAVKDYDERLLFDRNAETGDWCVFIRMPRPQEPYPVLGFGDRIPEPHEALERLKRADTMRSGDAIYREVVRSQKAYRAELEYIGDQASAESAEAAEHLLRKHGKSPIVKVFMPGKEVSASDS